jgi:hypothetical protein
VLSPITVADELGTAEIRAGDRRPLRLRGSSPTRRATWRRSRSTANGFSMIAGSAAIRSRRCSANSTLAHPDRARIHGRTATSSQFDEIRMVANSAVPLVGEFRGGTEVMKVYRELSPVADRSPLRSSGPTRSIATLNGRGCLAREIIDGVEGQTSVEITGTYRDLRLLGYAVHRATAPIPYWCSSGCPNPVSISKASTPVLQPDSAFGPTRSATSP